MTMSFGCIFLNAARASAAVGYKDFGKSPGSAMPPGFIVQSIYQKLGKILFLICLSFFAVCAFRNLS